MKYSIYKHVLWLSFITLGLLKGYAQNCADFPAPQVTVLSPTSVALGSITITNLPPGASSSLDEQPFTVGKTVYVVAPAVYVVKMKLNGCESRKYVLVGRSGFGEPIERIGCFRIVNKATGKVLDVKGNSKADGALITQWQANGGANQLWKIITVANQVFIYSVSSGKAITLNNCTAGTVIKQSELQYIDSTQKFRFTDVTPGTPFNIYLGNPNCPALVSLRVQYPGIGDGAPVSAGIDDDSDLFKWLLEEAPCPNTSTATFDAKKCYSLTARHSNKAMEIATPSTLNGTNIQQNTYTGALKQIWRIKSIDATYNRVQNAFSGSVMDVKGATSADGANIQQYQNNGGDNQLWRFDKNAEGFYIISAKHSSKAVDVKGESTLDGANIQQYSKTGGKNQQWTVAEVGCPTGALPLQSAQIFSTNSYRDGYKGIITWVSNAADADYFTVEKRDKNGNFEILESVNAQPSKGISVNHYYTYTDNQTFEDENIYRIALTTYNAPPQYSPLINLNFKTTLDFTLSPNPTSEYIDIDLTAYKDRPVVLTLVDARGREMRSLSLEKADKMQRLELEGFMDGLYILKIHTVGKRDVTRLFNLTR